MMAYHPEIDLSNVTDPWRDTKVKGLNYGYANFDNLLWAFLTIF